MAHRRLASALGCALLGVLASTPRAAADDGPRLLTDPQQLSALGFPGDARNVYAFVDRLNQPIREAAPEPSDYFGATASGFTSYSGLSFSPRNPNAVFFSPTDAEDLRHIDGDGAYRVQLDIPNGARLRAVRWWAFDADTTALLIFTVDRLCLPSQGAGAPVVTLLASQNTQGSSGDQTGEMLVDTTVDTKTCSYRVRALFGQSNADMRLYKVRAQWVRQVSPAPATATFGDVPLSHPFFRFVEALASSGITGGCGNGLFCPDAPVTRGQLAVFLATALGLNWGGL